MAALNMWTICDHAFTSLRAYCISPGRQSQQTEEYQVRKIWIYNAMTDIRVER